MVCEKHEDLVISMTELQVLLKNIAEDVKDIKADMKAVYWKLLPIASIAGGVVAYFIKG